jgi:hypothetical protein
VIYKASSQEISTKQHKKQSTSPGTTWLVSRKFQIQGHSIKEPTLPYLYFVLQQSLSEFTGCKPANSISGDNNEPKMIIQKSQETTLLMYHAPHHINKPPINTCININDSSI